MLFSSWLRNRTSNRAPRGLAQHRRTAPRFRPRLEALEDRWLPSQIGLTVTSLADAGAGTLRAAILTADAGSHSDKFTIDFGVTGTIDLLTPLPDLNNSIAIQGPGASSLTVERAAAASFASAIVTVDPGQTASLSGLTIANGNDGGIDNEGTLTVASCAVVNNSVVLGGGLYNGGTLTVSGSAVCGNSATQGGGIYNASILTVSGSTLSGNSASFGGGILAFGLMTVSGCTINDNSADFGGGIYTQQGVQQTISNSTLSGNSALGGGAIDNVVGTLTVSNSTICGNSATEGGGIENYGATLTIAKSTLSANTATLGGAFYNTVFDTHGASVTVRDSFFSGNSADLGGGIYNTAFATLDVRGSTLSGNSATDSGGGIYNLGMATLQQCTLSGNSAGADGGGIFNGASATLAVKDSTVLGNVAMLGADLFNDHGIVTINDSIIGDWFNA